MGGLGRSPLQRHVLGREQLPNREAWGQEASSFPVARKSPVFVACLLTMSLSSSEEHVFRRTGAAGMF